MEPKMDDPDGMEPLASDASVVAAKDKLVQPAMSSDPPEVRPPVVIPPPEPVVVDPPEEDELLNQSSFSLPPNLVSTEDHSTSTTGDELMGQMSEKNKDSIQACAKAAPATIVPTITVAAISSHSDHSNLDVGSHHDKQLLSNAPQSQELSGKPPPSPSKSFLGRIFGGSSRKLRAPARPFDELSEKEDPTDEGLLRVAENALQAEKDVTSDTSKSATRVAPALRTLASSDKANPAPPNAPTESTPIPFDEVDDGNMSESVADESTATGSVVKLIPMMIGDSSDVAPNDDDSRDGSENVKGTEAVTADAVDIATPTIEHDIPVTSSVISERKIDVDWGDPETEGNDSSNETANEVAPNKGDVEGGQTGDNWADFSKSNDVPTSAGERDDSREAPLLLNTPNSIKETKKERNTVTSNDRAGNDDDRRGGERGGNDGYWASPAIRLFALLICLLLIALAIALPLTLIRNNDDNDDNNRDVFIPPTPTQTQTKPTASPTNQALLTWVVAAPTLQGAPDSGVGSTVVMDGEFLAYSAPLLGNGSVTAFRYEDNLWVLSNELIGVEIESQFGFAVDISGTSMAVGSPLQKIPNSFIPSGSAYAYNFSAEEAKWVPIGSEIRGDQDIFAANELFGYSVGIGMDSSTRQALLAVGAPKSNIGNITERGRVYTFRGGSNDGVFGWEYLEGNSSFLVGKNEYDWFGAAIDVSRDGSRVVIGAPGNATGQNGYVALYYWSGTEWLLEFERTGTDGEGLGASVVMLSDSGDQIAVGSPQFQNSSGKISVFEVLQQNVPQQTDFRRRRAAQIGSDIIGSSGDRLGSNGTIRGGSFENGISIVASTSSGVVRTLLFNRQNNRWDPLFEDLRTDVKRSVIGFSNISSGLLVVGNAESDELQIYGTKGPETVAPVQVGAAPTFTPGNPISVPVSVPSPQLASPVTNPINGTTAPTASAGPPIQSPLVDAPTIIPAVAPSASISAMPTLALSPTTVPNAIIPSSATFPPTVVTDSSDPWVQTGSSFTPREVEWNYGSAVAFAPPAVAIGAPLALQNGAVFIHAFDPNSGTWLTEATDQLFGENNGDRFGTSLAMTSNLLVVGAPFVLVSGTQTKAGAAYCFRNSGGKWMKSGNILKGDSGVYATDEQFGASVAISDNGLIVVGAKGSSVDLEAERGRVYVFATNGGSSESTLVQNFTGLAAGDRYGSAVDISMDGSRFVAGAPGSEKGYATVYQRAGSDWLSVFLVAGEEKGDALGSSVKFLSSDGSILAVGSPYHQGNQGRVSIYQLNGSTYTLLGQPIVGVAAEFLGAAGMISGGETSAPLILGTALGDVKKFGFETASNTWIQVGTTLDVANSPLLQVASSSDVGQVAVGFPDNAMIYQLK